MWWALKPESTLNSFVQEFIEEQPCFILDDLVDAITKKAWQKHLIEPGNNSIITADSQLLAAFDCHLIHVEELYEKCLDHVYILSTDESFKLQQDYVHNNFSINILDKFIFDDPLSVFYPHPLINAVVFDNKAPTYNWNDLTQNFINFCNSNQSDIIKLNNNFYKFANHSYLKELFQFTYFHAKQINDILLQTTKFLGKEINLINFCPHLNLEPNNNVYSFLNLIVNKYSDLLPHFNSVVKI